MNVYIHLLRATEIAFLDHIDNQSSLSFHWQIQVVQRRFWETTMGWSGRIFSLPGHLPAQRLMWGLRHKTWGSFVRWYKISPKLPCWANNVILILQRITLLLVSLLWQAKLGSINCPIGKSAWLFCHQQIRKFLPPPQFDTSDDAPYHLLIWRLYCKGGLHLGLSSAAHRRCWGSAVTCDFARQLQRIN